MLQEISDAISQVQSSNEDQGSGRVCTFYKVSETTGAKVFKTYEVATNNWLSQIALAGHKVAPKVLSDVIEFDDGGTVRYMFLTEIAKTVYEIAVEEFLICDNAYNTFCDCSMCYESDFEEECYEQHELFWEIGELWEKLNELELYDVDRHWGNYGFLPNGTAVVIDCEFYHR